MTFRAELISDTHLNIWKLNPKQITPLFPGLEPNLILAGDIGDPDEASLYNALLLARKKYRHIIYIPGNHEFYIREPGSKKTPTSVLSWFQKLDDQWDNFHFFYRRSEVLDGVRIIGATAWSTSPKPTAWSHSISEEGRLDRRFLEQAISTSKEPALVVTHYPSTLRILQDGFKDTPAQYDYAQDLEYLYQPPVHTWIFGHVHQKHDFKLPYSSIHGDRTIRILCNPYGYPNEGSGTVRPKRFTMPSVTSSVKYLGDTTYRIL